MLLIWLLLLKQAAEGTEVLKESEQSEMNFSSPAGMAVSIGGLCSVNARYKMPSVP